MMKFGFHLKGKKPQCMKLSPEKFLFCLCTSQRGACVALAPQAPPQPASLTQTRSESLNSPRMSKLPILF